jgi:hypothetical protein
MTIDAGAVNAIERRHELALLEQLLAEKRRPVPPPPTTHRQLRDLMRLIASTFTEKRNAA